MSYVDIDEYGNVEWPMPDSPALLSEPRDAESWLPLPEIEPLPQAIHEHGQKKAEDDFRNPVTAGHKRRRTLEDEPEVPQQRKVHVTEQLRARENTRYTAVRALNKFAFRNPLCRWTGWLRREVGGRLYRGLVNACTELVGANTQSRELERDVAVRQHQREWQQQQTQATTFEPAPELPGNFFESEDEQSASDVVEEVHNREQGAIVNTSTDEEVVDERADGPHLSSWGLPAEDHVFPEHPNLESYRQVMRGDARCGVFSCEYCAQLFSIARSLRLHMVDEHLSMTGGAGPAGTIEYNE
jgi:hypothetical protein